MTIKKASPAEWNAFTAACASATFFHTLDWYLVWKAYEGYDLETLLFEFENGKKVLFPLASIKKMGGLYKEYISSPAGTYGGFLTNEELTTEEWGRLIKYIKKYKCLTLRENVLSKKEGEMAWTRAGFSQIIPLAENCEKWIQNWTNAHQRSLKKSIKVGIEVAAAYTTKDWEAYYGLYLESLKRWGINGTSCYTWDLFAVLQKMPASKCILWLAKYQGKIISGCLCFYHNQHVVYWHGAALSSYFYLKPNHSLHYKIISDALAKGFNYYDFNPSSGHEGLVRFKKGFGTKKYDANVYVKQSIGIRFIHKIENIIS